MICETIPNPGKIRIYTSGCPKNQNKCWYKIGSPPPKGSKKQVLKLRSKSSIVIAPANTGKDKSKRIAVINTDHTNKGIDSSLIDRIRILIVVVIKLTAPKIEETPAMCREKIVRSTAGPLWAKYDAKGGYTVHPVPAPCSLIVPLIIRRREGGRSQNLRLFIRGKAISGAPIIRGTNQFPKPPISVGITKKKIMINAWLVIDTL